MKVGPAREERGGAAGDRLEVALGGQLRELVGGHHLVDLAEPAGAGGEGVDAGAQLDRSDPAPAQLLAEGGGLRGALAGGRAGGGCRFREKC